MKFPYSEIVLEHFRHPFALRSMTVAGDLYEVDLRGYINISQQIGQKDHCAFQHTHNGDPLVAIIT